MVKIFLDMDGVLSDFVGQCEKVFETKIYEMFDKPEGVPGYSVPELLGITMEEFWEKIDDHDEFWPDMPMYPWAQELYAYCLELGETFILSTPSENPGSLMDKRLWLTNNFGITHPEKYIFTGAKYLLAKPDCLLIDDYDSHCEKFNAAGGMVVLFPRPWNANREVSSQCLKFTKDMMSIAVNLTPAKKLDLIGEILTSKEFQVHPAVPGIPMTSEDKLKAIQAIFKIADSLK
jgi:5'(3')-deoxyribonucleotidase